MYHILVDEHLGCFHLGTVMTSAAVDVRVRAFVLTYVFNNLEYTARSSAGSCGYSVFNFLRNCQTLSRILYKHRIIVSILFSILKMSG